MHTSSHNLVAPSVFFNFSFSLLLAWVWLQRHRKTRGIKGKPSLVKNALGFTRTLKSLFFLTLSSKSQLSVGIISYRMLLLLILLRETIFIKGNGEDVIQTWETLRFLSDFRLFLFFLNMIFFDGVFMILKYKMKHL